MSEIPNEHILSGREKFSNFDNGEKNIEPNVLGIKPKDFKAYIGAMLYGCLENARAMGFHPLPDTEVMIQRETIARATTGLQKMFDQHTGDGTIVALGFIGADVLLIMADNAAKKLGKKGFDPTIRFLS